MLMSTMTAIIIMIAVVVHDDGEKVDASNGQIMLEQMATLL